MKKEIVSLVFIVWLSILPLVFWNGTYEGTKVVYLFCGGFFLTTIMLVGLLQNQRMIIDRIDKLYFLWLAILFISSLFGIHPIESIIGGNYRHQGILFFFTLWLVGKNINFLTANFKALLTKLMTISVILVGVLVIIDYFSYMTNWKLTGYKGPLGTLGESNAAAGLIVLGLFLLPEVKWLSHYLKILLIIIAGLAVCFLKSLSAGVILSEIILLNLFLRFQKKLMIIFSLAIIPVMFFAAFYQTKSIDIGQSLETRSVIWSYSLEAISKRPLLGYGAESNTAVFDDLFAKKQIVNTSLDIDRSHNLALDLLTWSGVIGLVSFLSWLAVGVVGLMKHQNWTRVAAVIGWLTFASVQPLSVVHWVLLVIFINL